MAKHQSKHSAPGKQESSRSSRKDKGNDAQVTEMQPDAGLDKEMLLPEGDSAQKDADEKEALQKSIEKQRDKQLSRRSSSGPRHAATTSSNDARTAREIRSSRSSSAQPLNAADVAKRRKREKEMLKKATRKRRIKVLIIAIVAILVLGYAVTALHFTNHLMPHSYLGDVNVSGQEPEKVQDAMDTYYADYVLSISGHGFSYTLEADTIDFGFSDKTVMAAQNAWLWPVDIFKRHDILEHCKVSYDKDKVHGWLQEAVSNHNLTATPSKSNVMTYNEDTKKIEFKEVEYGNALDLDAVYKEVCAALDVAQTECVLSDAALQQPADILTDKKKIAAAVEEANATYNTSQLFMLGDQVPFEVNASHYAQWLYLDKGYNLVLDEEAQAEWIDWVVSCLNAKGGSRTYIRPDGKQCDVSGGVYGFVCSDLEQAKALITAGVLNPSSETISVPCDEVGTGFWGNPGADWGKRYIDVDITQQHVRFYDEKGEIIWESDCVTGQDNGLYDTPTGVWTINDKQSPAALRSYGIETYTDENGETVEVEKQYGRDVEYWMPFITNFIGLHDGWWLDAFGGELYHSAAYGSGGCVNLPPEKAKELYAIVNIGDIVVTHF